MTLEELYIDDPLRLEKEIEEVSGEVARKLVWLRGMVSFEFEGAAFIAKHEVIGKEIRIVIASEEKRKKAGYMPFTCTAEVENELTETENVKAVLEAFLRHITGAVRAEVL